MELFLKFFVSLISLYNFKENDNQWRRNVSPRNSTNVLQLEARRTFFITSGRSRRCVEIPGASTALPTQADIYDCDEKAAHQIWYADYNQFLVPGEKFMHLKHVKTGACLGILGGDTDAENVAVGETPCQETPNAGQYWAFYPLPQPFPGIIPPMEHHYMLRNLNHKCATVDGDTSQPNNARLVIRTCDESMQFVNQRFQFQTTDHAEFYI